MIPLEKLEKINQEAGQRCSSALSKLTHKHVEVEFFESFVTELKKIPPFITSSKRGASIFLPVIGIPGSGLLFFPEEDSLNLCDIIMKREIGATRKLSEFEQGIMKEVGNILLGNYLTIFSNALKVELIAGMPYFSFDTLSALLEKVVVNFAKDTLEVLVLKIRFNFTPGKTVKEARGQTLR